MGKPGTVIHFVLMAAVIVAADFLFLRHNFQARLVANIGIVVMFAVIYLWFLK